MTEKLRGGRLVAAIILFVILAAVVIVGIVAFWTWLTMLAFGISHSIDSEIPAIGFKASFPFGALLSILAVGNNARSQK